MRLFLAVLALTGMLSHARAQEPSYQPRHGNGLTGRVPAAEWRWAVASWYGPGFHGRRTASGARFNSSGLTFAHKTMRFGTRVRFHHSGRSVVCICTDRGPFVRGREYDLSAGCAKAIGMGGVRRVRAERVS